MESALWNASRYLLNSFILIPDGYMQLNYTGGILSKAVVATLILMLKIFSNSSCHRCIIKIQNRLQFHNSKYLINIENMNLLKPRVFAEISIFILSDITIR